MIREPKNEPLRISVPRLALKRAWLAVDQAARLTVQLRGVDDPVGIGLGTLRDQLESLAKRLQLERRVLSTMIPADHIRAEIAARLRESVTV